MNVYLLSKPQCNYPFDEAICEIIFDFMASFVDDSRTQPLDNFRECHGDSYSKVVSGCCDALSGVWSEIGVLSADAQSELSKIATDVTRVWQSAVRDAEQQRDDLRQRIHEVASEIHSIQSQLGDLTERRDPSTEIPLKQRFDAMNQLKEQFLEMKRKRISEFEGHTLLHIFTRSL